MNFLCLRCFDSEDSKYFHDEAVRYFFVVFSQGGKHAQHKVLFTLCHRLNNKLSIVAEEKEASTSSRTFSCLKYLVTIKFRTQTLLNDFHITEVFLESRHEEVSLVECNLDIRPESYRASFAFLLSCQPGF